MSTEKDNAVFVFPKKKIKIINLGKRKFSNLAMYPRTRKSLTTVLGKDRRYKTGLTPTEETFFEKELGLKPGALSRKPNDENGTNYWADLKIIFDSKGHNELELDNITDYIKYKEAIEHPLICNSPLEKLKWPAAEWMIIDEESDATLEAVDIDHELEASELFNDMPAEDKKSMLRLYGERKLDKVSPNLIKSSLFKHMKKDPIKFKKLASVKSLKVRIFLVDLLEAKVVTRNGNYFKNGDDPIGNSTDEVISYFEDPRNSSVKLALESKLKLGKK